MMLNAARTNLTCISSIRRGASQFSELKGLCVACAAAQLLIFDQHTAEGSQPLPGCLVCTQNGYKMIFDVTTSYHLPL